MLVGDAVADDIGGLDKSVGEFKLKTTYSNGLIGILEMKI
jgi:hypothetical protein